MGARLMNGNDRVGEQLTRWSFLVTVLHDALEAICSPKDIHERRGGTLTALKELHNIGPLVGLPPGVVADIESIRRWCSGEPVSFDDLSYTVGRVDAKDKIKDRL